MKNVKIGVAVISLLLGCFFYLGFRQETLLMFHWAARLDIIEFVKGVRIAANEAKFLRDTYVIYSVPYGLWVISFCSFVGAVWHEDTSAASVVWRLAAPIIAIGSEGLQFLGLLPGVFDKGDMMTLLFASIVGVTISFL